MSESRRSRQGLPRTRAHPASKRDLLVGAGVLVVLVAAGISVQDKISSAGSAPSKSNSVAPGFTAPVTTSGVSAGSGPAITTVIDLNWINAATGWALATRTGAYGTDEVVFSTTDAGASWSSEVVQIPSASFDHIRFSNHEIGFIWGGGAAVI